MSDLLERLAANIEQGGLLPRGHRILVAVSGGADSMTLLHALVALAPAYRWKIHLAHFNHRLRGRSSDADERLVRQMGLALKLPVLVERAEVRRFAHKSKLSLEMASRKLRHEFLARAARKRNISRVALAHHADDQVEHFFLRVLRGAGGEGLAGMKVLSPSPADPGLILVRPLLEFSRAELREFARRNHHRFREDASNAQWSTLRNRIRHELLPLLRRHYQPGLSKIVLRLMEIVGAEADIIGELARNWLRRRRPAFKGLSTAVQRRVLQSQLIRLGLAPDFELVEALRRSANTRISVGTRLSVWRNASGRVVLHHRPALPAFESKELVVNLTRRSGQAVFGDALITWKLDSHGRRQPPKRKSGVETFDADRVGSPILLRHWEPGDRYQPTGLKSPAKLQDLFTNAKIPRPRRHRLMMAVAAGGDIFWVEGLRISENFKLRPETKSRLEWRWRRPPGRSQSV